MLRAVVGLAVLSAACAPVILTSPDGSARTTLYHSTDRSPFRIGQVILP